MAYVALLRAVNVAGAKLPMAALREACAAIGWRDVRTYIQSGNILFDADGSAESLEAALETLLLDRFQLKRPALVRSSAQWRGYAAGSPFPDAERDGPARLHLCLAKQKIAPGAAALLETKAAAGERIALAGDALWIDYAGGVGRSKLTPALLDKAAGSPVTARNWRTVCTLQEMLRQ